MFMPLKLNISEKGKAWKLEVETDVLEGKSLGDTINGSLIKPEFDGYELYISGGTDFAGFPLCIDVEGIGLKRILRNLGWGMHKLPKKEKKTRQADKGLRLRKTCRGKTIAETTTQVNINVLKSGAKSLAEIFPDQNSSPQEETPQVAKPSEEASNKSNSVTKTQEVKETPKIEATTHEAHAAEIQKTEDTPKAEEKTE